MFIIHWSLFPAKIICPGMKSWALCTIVFGYVYLRIEVWQSHFLISMAEELGKLEETVSCLRATDWIDGEPQRLSITQNKPVLLLFQEIPGWCTCTEFGSGPLSDNTVLALIRDQFITVIIQNNTPSGSPDEQVLRYFNEASWNNPVLRFLHFPDGNTPCDVLPRKDGVYSTADVHSRLTETLRAYQQTN